IVLWEPKVTTDTATLDLTKGSTTVQASVEVVSDATGRRMIARTSRDQLSDGIWKLLLRSGSEQDPVEEPVAARLLVRRRRPLALLRGATAGRSEAPTRRSGPASVKPVSHPGRRAAAAQAGKVIDRALKVLPAERAAQVRGKIRSTARRVLK